jgi:hypothetical protein
MCLYCQYDHNFWDDVVKGAQRITILTDEEVEQLYRNRPDLRPGATKDAEAQTND